jgi:UDP-N-acetylmuramoyl-tripeptide--D-alanyl-D-alanine ligase
MKKILEILEKNNFQVSTDTRKDVRGTVFFAIKGENFDGNKFVEDAIKKGATAAVCSAKINLPNVFVVKNTLTTLQKAATVYRKKFSIPVVVIGGSNGKTTSKDLLADALKTKFNILKTEGSFNNHLGVPLTLLAMKTKHQIAVLEIGANHPKEHTDLLDIINPTHVVVTNNGMDHLEGFGSPAGARKANKEIFDWAARHKCPVFVNSKHKDLLADSKKCARIKYPAKKDTMKIGKNVAPLDVVFGSKKYKTKLSGEYNLENIELAVSIAASFGVPAEKSLGAICQYVPESKRSQIFEKDGIEFTLDCYNANPTSMALSIESFNKSAHKKRGVILGDMLELGKFSNNEHKKIIRLVKKMKFDMAIFIGPRFKKILMKEKFSFRHFDSSEKAAAWFRLQNFSDYSFLLKGSRGMKIEKVIEKHSKKLSEILAGVKIIGRGDDTDISVSKICFDSRKIIPNSLFVAISGTNKDGSEFIDDAINSGATVIVCEKPFLKKKTGVVFIRVSDARLALSIIAQNFYGNPSRDLKIVGITGTNGKTTTATLLFNLFRKLNLPAAKITTIENKINNDIYPATQTTPDPVALAEFFAASVACGVTYVFMECSSHAIDQKRILGINFTGGIFTNLTLDHLDYHKTMENYALAKKTFFDCLPPRPNFLPPLSPAA